MFIRKEIIKVYNHLSNDLKKQVQDHGILVQFMDLGVVFKLKFRQDGLPRKRMKMYREGNKTSKSLFVTDVEVDADTLLGQNGHFQIGKRQLLYKGGIYWHIGCTEYNHLYSATLLKYERDI